MIWEKKGLIYSPPGDGSWKDNSALTPTAIQLNESVIRIYASFRDSKGVGRIGFVDVDSANPAKILGVSSEPALNIGEAGMFDDNGVILGDIIKVNESLYMYYVGFQLVDKVKFLAYSGLAISSDGGNIFKRYSCAPVMDRSDEAKYIRAIHSVLHEDGKFKCWYATGNGWQSIEGKDYPKYDINYVESRDGICFSKGKKVISNDIENGEYRIGRPRVYRYDGNYLMNFTYGTIDGRYIAGQAFSRDGISWDRDDSKIGIKLSEEGWDSKHLCYPCIVNTTQGRTFMFYNGNDMGYQGFGYAELKDSNS